MMQVVMELFYGDQKNYIFPNNDGSLVIVFEKKLEAGLILSWRP